MDAIVMTVFNRPHDMLRRTFKGLCASDLDGVRVIVVDDASDFDYTSLKTEFPLFEWHRVDTGYARPGAYQVNGWNLEVYAMNYGFEVAHALTAERIFILSSDVIVHPESLRQARYIIDTEEAVYVSSVIDEESKREYCGADRVFPMHWFMGAKGRWIKGVGGFDEDFLAGVAWADNDFSARLLLSVGMMFIDTKHAAIHQSHPDTSYSDGGAGWKTNLARITKKWGCSTPPMMNNLYPLSYKIDRGERGIFLCRPKSSKETA